VRFAWAALPAVALGFGCPADEGLDPAPISCSADEHLDGDRCVPVRCGTGTWGDLDPEGALHVAPGGQGAGGPDEPMGSIQAAVNAAEAAGVSRVVVAAGRYVENLELTGGPLVMIEGRCRDLVVIDGRGDLRPAVHWRAGEDRLRGVTVTGGTIGLLFEADPGSGVIAVVEDVTVVANDDTGVLAIGPSTLAELENVLVADTRPPGEPGFLAIGVQAFGGAALTLADVVIEDSPHTGLRIQGGGSFVYARSTTVRGMRLEGEPTSGTGVLVTDGGSLTALDLVSEDNELFGVVVANATATITGCRVSGNRNGDPVHIGGGLLVTDGATATLSDCIVEGNLGVGVAAEEGASVVLQGGEVRETLQYEAVDDAGFGVSARSGATLRATGTLIEDNVIFGAAVGGVEGSMHLQDVTIRGTRPGSSGYLGRGVSVACPPDDAACNPTLTMTGGLVEANHDGGINVVGPRSTAVLDGVTVRDTRPLPLLGTSGWGVVASRGGLVEGTDLRVEGSHEVGVATIGAGSRVALEGGEVVGTRAGIVGFGGIGLATQLGSEITAHGTRVADGAGPGALAIGGRIVLTETVLEGNGFAGVVVAGATGRVEMSGGSIRGTRPSDVFGGGVGAFATAMVGSPELALSGVLIEDLPGPGAYLTGEGQVEVRDCTFRTSGRASVPGGVLAVDAGTPEPASLVIADSAFVDLPGGALLLSGSTAELTGLSFDGVGGPPLTVQACGSVPEPELVDTAADPTCGPYRFDVDPRLRFDFSLSEVSVEE